MNGAHVEINSRMNGKPRIHGRVLVLLCAYRGGRAALAARGLGARIGPRLRSHNAIYSDHYANPRRADYQLAAAEAALAGAAITACDWRIDQALASALPAVARAHTFTHITPAEVRRGGPWDTIVLVYADALGLSWAPLEHAARAVCGSVVVVNGRRRAFTLTPASARALAWRRLLATTRVLELLATLALLPLAAALATFDALRGRD